MLNAFELDDEAGEQDFCVPELDSGLLEVEDTSLELQNSLLRHSSCITQAQDSKDDNSTDLIGSAFPCKYVATEEEGMPKREGLMKKTARRYRRVQKAQYVHVDKV